MLQICWYSGAVKHLLFLCHKISASNLLILWYIEISAALLMWQDLYCKFVESLVHWSICSSYVTRFVLQPCWYSGIMKHLLFLCHKICTADLLILWYIETPAIFMSQDLCFNPVDTQVYWSICSSNVTRFGLQICWYAGILKHLLFLCHKICASRVGKKSLRNWLN